jgi:transcriptional regulator with XRE-family HTH domain
MITNLGKELRKLRVDLGITLYDMAGAVGVSPSLLSSVETGKKPATESLIDKLAAVYHEVRDHKSRYMGLAMETRDEVRIRLQEDDAYRNDVAIAFARNFDTLSRSQLDAIFDVFNKKEEGTN